MTYPNVSFDFVVIGGGLGGLTAAHRLIDANKNIAIVDHSLPAANGRLGGFAKFSGAKFSLLPAGRGLLPVASSAEKFHAVINDVLGFLGLSGRSSMPSRETVQDKPLSLDLELRIYESILLTPTEIDRMIDAISQGLIDRATILAATAHRIYRSAGTWIVAGDDGVILATARSVVYAGGRTGGTLLREAGAAPQEGKGLDVGIRVEFADRNALSVLRAMGPDAKVLSGRCRTFCLNSPGSVYRYKYGDISIPGGVVADAGTPSGNVGFLLRIQPKLQKLADIERRLSGIGEASYTGGSWVRDHPFPEKRDLMVIVYGEEVVDSLLDFCHRLGRADMVDWSLPHIAHFPLLDWHWETYAVGPSHRTSLPGLYVVGDSAGHARGLLQAAISGWLAAAEALLDEAA